MPHESDRPAPPVNPRPGVANALGIANIVFAVLLLIGLLTEFFWVIAAARIGPTMQAEASTEGGSNPQAIAMMGMNDTAFVRFCLLDGVTGVAVNLAMLASGIGLINLRRWGSRAWAWAAWIKLARLVLLGGIFIILVAPTLSENMAHAGLAMVKQQQGSRGMGRGPTLADFTRIYSIMCLIMAAGMVVLGSIYPIASLWLLGRPGVQAALVGPPPKKEPEHP